MVFCCYVAKFNSSKGKVLHIFPKNPKDWLQVIGRLDMLENDTVTVSKYYTVCDAHFADEVKYRSDCSKTNLKANTVLSLHVPETAVHIQASLTELTLYSNVMCNQENNIHVHTTKIDHVHGSPVRCRSVAEEYYRNTFDFLMENSEIPAKKRRQRTPTVHHRAVSESEIVAHPARQMYSASASITSARPLPIPPYQATSPALGSYTGWTSFHCAPVGASALTQPPPIFVRRPCLNNSDVTVNRSFNDYTRTQSSLLRPVARTQQSCHVHEERFKVETAKVHGKRLHVPQVRDNGIIKSTGSRTPEGLRRIRGTHSSLAHVSEWARPQQLYNSFNITTDLNGSVHTQNNNYKHRSPSPMCEGQARDRNQWHGQSDHSFTVRNSRTPSPYEHAFLHTTNQQNTRTSPYQSNDIENEEVEKFFNPINNRTVNYSNNSIYMPIELQVTNLDQNIDPEEMKRILSFIFMEHVTVLHISVFMQSDGNFAASIKVPSLPDAQYAISQLHRRKVGCKRILISYAHSGGPNPQLIRAQTIMLLQEVPGHKLPLFKFREMYESRFMISISISELYKMKDVCMILEDPSGRMVALNPDHRNTPSPSFNNVTQEGNVELPFCIMHTTKPWSDKGWAEQEMATLPNVKISLKVLSSRIHQLLITHNGCLPLPSLPNCYEVEFKEKLQRTESGVPLEHLISCLPSIQLKQGVGSIKCLVPLGSKNEDDSYEESKCVSPPLANQLALFCRELVDLLKTAPHCQLPFNRFIPAYHHHFGRQCRVADYGFTKLIDLLEALKHTVQVMGEGNKRVVTLSHRAQVRRFTSDLLRVLKSKASKQVALSEFPCVYARVIAKPWDVADYGVCEIEDILDEVSESTVVVIKLTGDDKMIAIPKREQTAEEIERTKQFAVEVVELLRHAPQCRMLFNKFVPSYHHHFGYQCRVSDYGFTKLIELFEAIPEIVKIEDVNGGERQICLTEIEGLRVLSEQISKLVTFAKGTLSVTCIAQHFLRLFGYALRPELFGCNSILQLMQKLNDVIKIVHLPTGPAIVVMDRSHTQQLALQCRRILMDQPGYRIVPEKFQQLYFQFYSKSCDIDEVKTYLSSVIQFTTHNGKPSIELTPLYCFACDLYHVLMNYGGTLYFSQFEAAYLSVIGSACRTSQYGFSTLSALLHALPCTITIKDTRHKKRIICLNKHLAAVGIPLPAACMTNTVYRETDSSSESFESDSSSQMKVSNLMTLEECGKWQTSDVIDNKQCWKQSNENNSWSECDNHWETRKSKEYSHNWPALETGSQAFLKNLNLPLSPPKPDSPEETESSESEQWKSSVWTTPTKFLYSGHESINVEVPPLQLPSWNTSDQNLSNLLSPMKNLLSAAPNPLNPRTSPYFTTKRTVVIAPHPSELPLPALSLTPKKNLSPQNATQLENIADNEKMIISKSMELINKIGNGKEDSNVDVGERNEIQSTSSKMFVMAKRRLAAQFNQPMES